jgi:plasmid stabilization system protein ParE
VTTLWFSKRARADLERLFDFIGERDLSAADVALALIEDALKSLRRHPYLGRPVTRGLRELVISRGRSGYLA